MTRHSTTRSRCECGHKIVLVNGVWQHKTPHPFHACNCTDPRPAANLDGAPGRMKVQHVHCGICQNFQSMVRPDDDVAREHQYITGGA